MARKCCFGGYVLQLFLTLNASGSGSIRQPYGPSTSHSTVNHEDQINQTPYLHASGHSNHGSSWENVHHSGSRNHSSSRFRRQNNISNAGDSENFAGAAQTYSRVEAILRRRFRGASPTTFASAAKEVIDCAQRFLEERHIPTRISRPGSSLPSGGAILDGFLRRNTYVSSSF